MRRREFVSLLSTAALPAASGIISAVSYGRLLSPSRALSASRAQQALPEAAQWLRSGPMPLHSELTETSIWLQTRRPCPAQLRYWKRGETDTARLSAPVETATANDCIARFNLERLQFGTRYDYEIYLDGLRVPFSNLPSFQSQPMWRHRTEPPPFRIAIGSCAYINDPDYDRPGESYGGGYEIFSAIARQKPDAMLWLGDNVYYREADWLGETAMRYRWAQNRELPELRELLAATHHYAIWDDHDFGPNDSDRAYRDRARSLRVFQDYWGNATYGTPETPGVFGRFEWSDTEFFLLDNRYYRSPNRSLPDRHKIMFGPAQMEWLKDALVSSNATFKIIAGGNQMLNPLTPYEAFGNFPQEQRQLLDFIREARIGGVVFISGDRHHTELIKRVEPGVYPLYDFTSSPLTSSPAKVTANEADNPARVPGTWVTGVRNFGLLEASGPSKDRRLLMRTLDGAGKELWRHEIKATDLQFGAKS
jgi:alkaline phosphatase D